jgi:hypothetical protein
MTMTSDAPAGDNPRDEGGGWTVQGRRRRRRNPPRAIDSPRDTPRNAEVPTARVTVPPPPRGTHRPFEVRAVHAGTGAPAPLGEALPGLDSSIAVRLNALLQPIGHYVASHRSRRTLITSLNTVDPGAFTGVPAPLDQGARLNVGRFVVYLVPTSGAHHRRVQIKCNLIRQGRTAELTDQQCLDHHCMLQQSLKTIGPHWTPASPLRTYTDKGQSYVCLYERVSTGPLTDEALSALAFPPVTRYAVGTLVMYTHITVLSGEPALPTPVDLALIADLPLVSNKDNTPGRQPTSSAPTRIVPRTASDPAADTHPTEPPIPGNPSAEPVNGTQEVVASCASTQLQPAATPPLPDDVAGDCADGDAGSSVAGDVAPDTETPPSPGTPATSNHDEADSVDAFAAGPDAVQADPATWPPVGATLCAPVDVEMPQGDQGANEECGDVSPPASPVRRSPGASRPRRQNHASTLGLTTAVTPPKQARRANELRISPGSPRPGPSRQ